MQPMPRILLVGDSITQESFQPNGWGSALANWYIRRADVINRGLDGYNTRWVLQRRDSSPRRWDLPAATGSCSPR
jgi:hypothetical protein